MNRIHDHDLSSENSEHEYDWDMSFDPMALTPKNSTCLNSVIYNHHEVENEFEAETSDPSYENLPTQDIHDQVDGESHHGGPHDTSNANSTETDEDENWWWSTNNTHSYKYKKWFLKYGQPEKDVFSFPNPTRRRFNGMFNPNPQTLLENKREKYKDRCGDQARCNDFRLGVFPSTSQTSLTSDASSSKETEYFSLDTLEPGIEELRNELTDIELYPLQPRPILNTVVDVSTQTSFQSMKTSMPTNDKKDLKNSSTCSPSSLSFCSRGSDQSLFTILAARGEDSIETLTSTSETESTEFIYKPVPTFQDTFSQTSYFNPDTMWSLHDEQTPFSTNQRTSTTLLEETKKTESNLTQQTMKRLDEIINESDVHVQSLRIFAPRNLAMIDRGTSMPLLSERTHKSTSTATLESFGRQDVGIQTFTVDSKNVEIQTDVLGMSKWESTESFSDTTSEQNGSITVGAEPNLTPQSLLLKLTTPKKRKVSALPRLALGVGVVNQKATTQTLTLNQPMSKPSENHTPVSPYLRYVKEQMDVEDRRPSFIPKPTRKHRFQVMGSPK